ncbi:MAG TPA: hypothetical protein VHV08_11935 [Pirellulales bacterium]|nr:hypothetical protein [Pirellulales bacterium]
MGALALWALFVATGVYLYNFKIWAAVIVTACMAVFLGSWLLLLWTHRMRTPRN